MIESFSYSYDSRGNRLAKTFADGTSELYGYDELSRLVRVVYPSKRVVLYRYDGVGNRLEMTEGTSGGAAGATCAGDADCDGRLDLVDNCPTVHNPGQTDSDAPATPSGLVAGYNMDEQTGTSRIADVTGRNHGSAAVGMGHVPGKYGNGLQTVIHGPVSQVVTIPSSPTLDVLGRDITLAAWIKPESDLFSAAGHIINKAGQFSLLSVRDIEDYGYRGHRLHVQLSLFSGGFIPATVDSPTYGIQDGVWTHVAATVSSGQAKLYVNGDLVAQKTLPDTLFNASGTAMFLGCGSFSGVSCTAAGSDYFGAMDEVAIWSRVLSQAEIRTAMNTPLTIQDRLGDICDACPTNPDRTCAPRTCLDRDGDGYGAQGASACSAGQPMALDCNDASAPIRPGAVEVCDGADNNCDGRIDEACLQGAVSTVYSYNAFNQLLASGSPVACAAGDSDCDGVPDGADNCPVVHNPGQGESDRPQIGGNGAFSAWTFDGSNAHDALGPNSGTLKGSARFAAGRSASSMQALDLDGTDGYVEIPAPMVGFNRDGITVEAWVRATGAVRGGLEGIVSQDSTASAQAPFALMLNGPELLGRLHHQQQPVLLHRVDRVPARPLGARGRHLGRPRHPHVSRRSEGDGHRGVAPAPSGGHRRLADRRRPQPAEHVAIQRQDRRRGSLRPRPAGRRDSGASRQRRRQGRRLRRLPDQPQRRPARRLPAPTPTATGMELRVHQRVPGARTSSTATTPTLAFDPGAQEMVDGLDNDCDGVIDGKIVAATATAQAYDANGNQVRKAAADGNTEYVFDARDRLVEVKSGATTVARYGYDTQNLRVYMNDAGGERRVLLDGVEELAEYEAGAMSRVGRYDHDPSRIDALLAQVAGGKTHAVTDALGSVYGLTDATAAVQARYSYDAFGARTASTETVATAWGFTGRRGDARGRCTTVRGTTNPKPGHSLRPIPRFTRSCARGADFGRTSTPL